MCDAPKCGTLGPTMSTIRRDRTTGELFRPSPPLQTIRLLAIWLTLSAVLTVASTALSVPVLSGLACCWPALSLSHTWHYTTGRL